MAKGLDADAVGGAGCNTGTAAVAGIFINLRFGDPSHTELKANGPGRAGILAVLADNAAVGKAAVVNAGNVVPWRLFSIEQRLFAGFDAFLAERAFPFCEVQRWEAAISRLHHLLRAGADAVTTAGAATDEVSLADDPGQTDGLCWLRLERALKKAAPGGVHGLTQHLGKPDEQPITADKSDGDSGCQDNSQEQKQTQFLFLAGIGLIGGIHGALLVC